MAGMTEKQAESLDLVYSLEDKPPFGNALLSAVTHLLAIFVPMITPALIVGGALELPVEMTAYLVSMAMVASGVGTYLQVNRFGPVGSGMLSIQSVNFSFVTVMIALGTGMKEGGLTEDAMISTLLGVSFVGAFLVCFSAWLLPYLKKVITPALIVGGALELPVEMTAYLVSMAMVASGVGTYLQVNRFGPVGSGMLSIQSVNFSFVTVMIALGTGMKEGGLTEDVMISTLLGVSFVGAFLVCFSAWLLPYLKKVITPTVSGVVVMLIGLSLVHVGITDFGGGFGAKADGTFGSMENLGLASLVLLIVLVFNCLKNPLLRMSGIAVGLIVGYIVALFLGKVDFSALQNLPLITLPVPFKYGFAFDWHAFIVAGAIFLLSVFEAVGDLTATAMVSEQPIEGEEYTKRLRGGVLADGLVSVIATALGSLPLTTFAQNNGVIQMTGVASRHVGKYIAAILVLLGLFPVIGRAFTTIPSPVLGGAMVLMFGLIAIAGVRILVSHGIRRREAVIAATSVGLGLGVAFEPEVFKNLPVLFQNSISAGGIMAVLLNLVLPEDKTDKAVKVETDNLDH